MSYDQRVNDALRNPTEESLIKLITEEVDVSDVSVKAK